MTTKYDGGAYIPTTTVMDVSEIYSTEVTSPEFKELLVRLYQNFNNLALAMNVKDTAIYDTEEFVSGRTFFPDPALDSTSTTAPAQRQTYRKVISFGALPNAATKTVAHGITIDANTTFTRIYGTSSDPAGLIYVPLPYSSTTLNENINLFVDNTNVSITAGINATAFTITYVVLEYMKT